MSVLPRCITPVDGSFGKQLVNLDGKLVLTINNQLNGNKICFYGVSIRSKAFISPIGAGSESPTRS